MVLLKRINSGRLLNPRCINDQQPQSWAVTGACNNERVDVPVEAEFETNSARLRFADGGEVVVRFDEEQAASIKEALRERARRRGQITHNQRTSEVVAVDLIEFLRDEHLVLDLPVSDSWTTQTVHELAEEQGVPPISTIDDLRDDTISGHEAKAFIDALGL